MKNRFLLVILFIVIVSVFMVGCSQFLEKVGVVPSDNEEEMVDGKAPPEEGMVRVIIGFDKPPQEAEQALIRGIGGKIKTTYRMIPAIAAQVPEKAIEALKKNPNVTEIEMDTKVYAYEENSNWGIEAIGADIAHANYFLGDGIEVAVIDTGIDDSHSVLEVYGGYDFVNLDNDPADDNGHGTHVAGIIAANNPDIGVAPNVVLYALKALDAEGMGYISNIISAIQWASDPDGNGLADDRLDIINMSFGAPIGNIFLRLACHLAYRDGLLLVAAAGNESGGPVGYPAAYDRVVAVSATDVNNQIASFSSTGSEVELAAPGVEIYSTLPNYPCTLSGEYGYGYGILSGTSMACPHVVGAAALVWGANPGWSNEQVRNQLTSTAQDLELSSNEQGYGLVDVAAALGLDEEADTTPPAQVTGLTAIAVSSSQINLSWTANNETDLSHYNVYQGQSEDGTYNKIGDTDTTTYSVVNLEPSTTYWYKVSAVDISGNEGLLSAPTSGITYPSTEDKMMYVENISFLQESSKPRDNLHVTVKVVEDNVSSEPLSGVEVMMNLSWILTNNKTGARDFNGITNENGEVIFTIMKAREGDYTASITGLTLSGYSWDIDQGMIEEPYNWSK